MELMDKAVSRTITPEEQAELDGLISGAIARNMPTDPHGDYYRTGKPAYTKQAVWDTLHATTNDLSTQEAVDAAMEATKGIGSKAAEAVRASDWYKSLPPTAVAAPAQEVDPDDADVGFDEKAIEAAMDKLDAAPDFAPDDAFTEGDVAADPTVEEEPTPAPRKRGRKAKGALGAKTPVVAQQGVPDPNPAAPVETDRAKLKGMVAALSGFIHRLHGTSLEAEREKTGTWQKANELTAAVPDVLNTFIQIHRATKALEQSRAVLASGRMPVVGSKITSKNDTDTEVHQDPGAYTQIVERYNAESQQLATHFATLEAQVGRKNMLRVMYLAKKFNAQPSARVKVDGKTLAKPFGVTPITRTNSEAVNAVRFAQQYKLYREGKLGVQANQDKGVAAVAPDHTVPFNPLRTTSEEAKVDAAVRADGTRVPSQLERVARGELGLATRKDKSPVANLLAHIHRTSSNVMSAKMAGVLEKLLKNTGTLDKIKVVFNTSKQDKQKRAAVFSYSKGGVPTITIFENGQKSAIVLHEILHAATVSAIYNPSSEGAKAAVKNLGTLLKDVVSHLQKQDQAALEKDYPGLVSVLQTLQGLVSAKGAVTSEGVAEFVAYGFTHGPLQKFMSATAVQSKALKALPSPQKMWDMFTHLVKQLLGLHQVPNSQMSKFIEQGSALLREIEETPGSLDKVPDLGGLAAIDFDAAPEENADATARTAAQDATDSSYNKDAVKEQAKKAEAAARQKRADTETVREAQAAKEDRAATSGVKPRAVGDATVVDAAMRSLMNLFGGKNGWEARVNGYLEAAGNRMDKWMEKGESPAAALANWLGSKLVDKHGVSAVVRDIMFGMRANIHSATKDHIDAGNLLRSLDADKQQAMLDYLRFKEDKYLSKLEPAEAAAVKRVTAAFEALHAEAVAERLIPEKYKDYTLADFINIRGTRNFLGKNIQSLGDITPVSREKNMVPGRGVSDSFVFGADGKPLVQYKEGEHYLLMHRKEGGYAYLSNKSDAATAKALGLSRIKGEESLYTLRGRTDTGFLFDRPKRLSEYNDEVNTANAVTSLLFTMQEWTRRIEGTKFTAKMVNANKSGEGDAFMSEAKPDGVPDDRIIDLRKHGETDAKRVSRARLAGTWVFIPENKKDQWGDMAGKYVSGPVYAALSDLYNNDPIIQVESWNALVASWKKFKTVYSPTASVNNVLGNFVLSYYHDIPMRNIKLGFRVMFGTLYPEQFAKRGMRALTPDEVELGQEFLKSGATLGQFSEADFDKDTKGLLTRFLRDDTDPDSGSTRSLSKGLMEMQTLMSWMAGKDKQLTDFYSNQDNVFRMAAYMTYLEKEQAGSDPKPMSETLKKSAARFAAESFVDYDINAPAIRIARQTLLPFVAWPYRMVPIMARIAVAKPWKIASTLAAIYAINALGYAAAGGGDDEDEARANHDEYMQEAMWGGLFGFNAPTYVRMPWSDEGKEVFLGVGRIIPLADMATISDSGVPSMVMPGGPVMVLFSALMNHDSFMGKQISEDTDAPAEATAKRVGYVAEQMSPNILVQLKKLVTDVDKLGPLGAENNSWLQAVRVAGFSVRELDTAEQVFKRSQRDQRVSSAYTSAVSKVWRAQARDATPDWDAAYDEVLELSSRRDEELYGED